jgi:lactate dehydrogenase-like 2-hydroxyacid dehydrogenase
VAPSPKPDAEREFGARRVELRELLEVSDVVSLHAPSTPETHHMIGAAELELIGSEGVLVNTSRGSLVEAEALADALQRGTLGAAGLDVYESEPDIPASLLASPRCVLLPHIGSATRKARDAMARLVAENVIAVLQGKSPPNALG